MENNFLLQAHHKSFEVIGAFKAHSQLDGNLLLLVIAALGKIHHKRIGFAEVGLWLNQYIEYIVGEPLYLKLVFQGHGKTSVDFPGLGLALHQIVIPDLQHIMMRGRDELLVVFAVRLRSENTFRLDWLLIQVKDGLRRKRTQYGNK